MTFGEYLKFKRKVQGLTQQDLANKINVSDKTISKWENDSYLPDIDNIKELSKILNTSIYELVNHKDFNNYTNKELNKLKTNEVDNKRILNIVITIMLILSIIFNFYLYLNNKTTIYYIKNKNMNGILIQDKTNKLYLSKIKVSDYELNDIKSYKVKIYQDENIIYNYTSENSDLAAFLENINLYLNLKSKSKNIKISIEFDNKVDNYLEYNILFDKP